MSDPFIVEKLTKIWANDCGESFEIGPDSDSLGCVEIRHRDVDGKIYARITFPPETGKAFAQAIVDCADQLMPKEF